jgi:predicted DNA-binding protein
MTAEFAIVTVRLEKINKFKLKHIADCEGRTVSKQVRQVILRHIKDFEQENGKIDTERMV